MFGFALRGNCLVVSLLVLMAAGCATVPHDLPKESSMYVADTGGTHYGRLAADWAELHAGQSGFYPLSQGMDALGARLRIAEQAEKTIDLQYFLIKPDTAGRVVALSLLEAADRGVRVRFLLDDIFTTAPDRTLLLLNQHPNIEVRLFNPISRSGLHSLNFVGNFRQANRRMHNKSFTVDNCISIVGGRNIADEYFQLMDTSVFADFDVVAFGPVATEISVSFDEFWNHAMAIPVEQLASNEIAGGLAEERARIEEEARTIYQEVYGKALSSELMQELISGTRDFFAAEATVLYDDPEKLRNAVADEYKRLAAELDILLQQAEHEVMFLSPYYVPGKNGVEYVRSLVDKGVRTVVLTNSLASNNHVPVHSGYARYRKRVIEAGVELNEARADAGRVLQAGEGPDVLTLHTKMILIDRRYLFVGSLNLDPRSIDINAEMGLLIDSEELTGAIAEAIERLLPEIAYRVRLDDKGRVRWHAVIAGETVIETNEPQAGTWLRFKAWFMKIAPESQL
jgi:putative cardiolipin synthase